MAQLDIAFGLKLIHVKELKTIYGDLKFEPFLVVCHEPNYYTEEQKENEIKLTNYFNALLCIE